MSSITPSDKDELWQIVNEIGACGNDFWHNASADWWTAKVEEILARREAISNAKAVKAALEGLIKKRVEIWDDEDECDYVVVPVGDIKDAIAVQDTIIKEAGHGE